ncbi:MAG: glycosyltransferase [Acidobacteria bacterium]|nr:glycosyltransferase [Acidobacteriota bacterium]
MPAPTLLPVTTVPATSGAMPGISARNAPSHVVAHLKPDYLPITETFIYETLLHARRFEPVVVAEQLLNLDRFPVPRLVEVRTRPARPISRALARIGRGLSRMPSSQAYHYLRAVAGLRPSLMHAHFGLTGYFASAIRARLDIPLITTFYGYDLSMPDREPEWQARYLDLFRLGDLFLVEGPSMRNRLLDLGCPAHKVAIQRVGIDLSRFKFKPRAAAPDEEVVLLHCGRMVEKKGHEMALRALADCREEFPNVRLSMIGDGPLRAHLEELVGTLGLSESVAFLGSMGHADYVEALTRAHLVIQPSLTSEDGDSEGGAPTTLLEAQASGAPVVASKHADIPFVVEDGASGMLAAEADVAATSAALKRMLRARSRWPEFGRRGRHYVETYHEIGRTVEALEARYLRVLQPPGEGVRADSPSAR